MSYPFYPSSICTSCWYGGYLEPTLAPVGCRKCGGPGVSGGEPVPNGITNTQIPYVSSIPTQKKIQNAEDLCVFCLLTQQFSSSFSSSFPFQFFCY